MAGQTQSPPVCNGRLKGHCHASAIAATARIAAVEASREQHTGRTRAHVTVAKLSWRQVACLARLCLHAAAALACAGQPLALRFCCGPSAAGDLPAGAPRAAAGSARWGVACPDLACTCWEGAQHEGNLFGSPACSGRGSRRGLSTSGTACGQANAHDAIRLGRSAAP